MKYYEEPTHEQLVNFACVMISGRMLSGTEREVVEDFLRVPTAREAWLARHRKMQESADAL